MSALQPIVYVHTGIWPSPSPSTVFVTGTARGIADHTPAVFIVRNGSTASTASVFHDIIGLDMPERLRFYRAGRSGAVPGHTRFFLDAVRTIGRLAATSGVRAVMTRNIGFLPYLAFIRERYRVPCLFEAHDFFGNSAMRTDINRSLQHLKRSRLERHLLPRLDGLVCLTEPQRAVFAAQYPHLRSVVAPTGLAAVTRTPLPVERTLCYTGSLDPHKGLGLALTALSRTARDDIGLHVIGGRSEQEQRQFLSLARLMGIEDRVRLTTWVHHADIAHLIDQCSGGLVPLHDTPFNRHLTSPLKILDYFSRCRPVIAADLPSIRFYVKPDRHGLLFTPDDPGDLARTIDRFFAGTLAEQLSAHIAQDGERYLWTERGRILDDFITSIT